MSTSANPIPIVSTDGTSARNVASFSDSIKVLASIPYQKGEVIPCESVLQDRFIYGAAYDRLVASRYESDVTQRLWDEQYQRLFDPLQSLPTGAAIYLFKNTYGVAYKYFVDFAYANDKHRLPIGWQDKRMLNQALVLLTSRGYYLTVWYDHVALFDNDGICTDLGVRVAAAKLEDSMHNVIAVVGDEERM